jgi:hypothetical protein
LQPLLRCLHIVCLSHRVYAAQYCRYPRLPHSPRPGAILLFPPSRYFYLFRLGSRKLFSFTYLSRYIVCQTVRTPVSSEFSSSRGFIVLSPDGVYNVRMYIGRRECRSWSLRTSEMNKRQSKIWMPRTQVERGPAANTSGVICYQASVVLSRETIHAMLIVGGGITSAQLPLDRLVRLFEPMHCKLGMKRLQTSAEG